MVLHSRALALRIHSYHSSFLDSCPAVVLTVDERQVPSHTTATPAPNAKQRPRTKARFRALALLAIASVLGYTSLGPKRERKIFDPPRFTPFTIISREEVSSTCIILTLRPRNATLQDVESDPYTSWWQQGTWSVEVKQPQLQIARSYTPLPPRPEDRNGDLRFLIRKERNGEVSGYLHRLKVGDVVEMRGPNVELDLDETLQEVVFLAGGTGIAPPCSSRIYCLRGEKAMQNPKSGLPGRIGSGEDCVGGLSNSTNNGTARGKIVDELETIREKYPEFLTLEYLVDEEKTFVDRKRIAKITNSNVTRRGNEESSRLLVLSGPEGFIKYFAGPKLWEGKGGQGQLGGVIGDLGLKGWRIWKM